MTQLTLMLFRHDLRLSDQPALSYAHSLNHPILPLVIDDPQSPVRPRGAAAQAFYQQALHSLDQCWKGGMRIYQGSLFDALSVLKDLATITCVCWNKGATPEQRQQDLQWEKEITKHGLSSHQSDAATRLWESEQVCKPDGSPYKVFTAFYRKGCLGSAPQPRPMLPRIEVPPKLWDSELKAPFGLSVSKAYPPAPPWAQKILKYWDVSEKGARALWKRFVVEASADYKEGRNRLDQRGTTELSAYLACGIVSPHQLWYGAAELPPSKDREHFCQELGWREFSAYLLDHAPTLPTQNWNPAFDHFPWDDNPELLKLWQKGQTGIPVVDAGMRQLWETGYMHNRARMIVGSFLVKNLLLPWQQGERWFWDCLIDADLANNSASWQWVAGSGADAAPYFRIFNPILQAEKFDPEGIYIRRYVPELSNLPTKALYAPWEHEELCRMAGVRLGEHYPRPCVDLKKSRDRALEGFQKTKKSGE